MISLLQKTYHIHNGVCDQFDELRPFRIDQVDLEHLEILNKLLDFFERLTVILSTSRYFVSQRSLTRKVPFGEPDHPQL